MTIRSPIPPPNQRDAFGLEPLPGQGDEESETDRRLRIFRERIADAETDKVLKTIDGDWLKARAAYDDDTAAGIDSLIAARRRELQGGEGGK